MFLFINRGSNRGYCCEAFCDHWARSWDCHCWWVDTLFIFVISAKLATHKCRRSMLSSHTCSPRTSPLFLSLKQAQNKSAKHTGWLKAICLKQLCWIVQC